MASGTDPQERKQAFLDTALKLFSRKGYEKTTINDIIQAMGVSKVSYPTITAFPKMPADRSPQSHFFYPTTFRRSVCSSDTTKSPQGCKKI